MMQEVFSSFEKNWPSYLEELKGLVRIPSVSAEGYDPERVQASAQAVQRLFDKIGLENSEILPCPGDSPGHPYVYADWIRDPNKPTLLLYAHHDVQPPGREEIWESAPFEPVERDGRLFGRGAADDKAGILVHVAAIDSFLKTQGELPCNVKVIVEGEEEIGSGHFSQFLKENREKLRSDAMVLTDTANFDVGVPALTVGLRGMVTALIELRALSKTLHSGLWGGPLPDPAMALSRILAQMVDDAGQVAIPGIVEQIRPLSPEETAEYAALDFDEAQFRQQTGLVSSARVMGPGVSPWAQIWRFPSLVVNGIQASSRKSPGNIINDVAWAKVSIRLGPGMDADSCQAALNQFIRERVPWGLELDLKEEFRANPWSMEPKGPYFDIARRALEKGYGKKPVLMGCGGSIPFVAPMTEAFDVPALLVGVEDPFTNAHGENESLCIADLKSACLSQIHLLEEVGRTL